MNLPSLTFHDRALRIWLSTFAAAVGMFAAWIALRYAQQPLLEAHGFRQTQTALTALWMMREGWDLAYQTPVVGYPWSIPFEFPIFQVLAATISGVSGMPLDSVGRLLSFSFLIACAGPTFAIARRLDLPYHMAWALCALLWSSPIYLFWGRTFMVETAALFFILAAIPYALDLRQNFPNWRSILFFMLFTSLGMLQKVTTAAPVILVLAAVVSLSQIKAAGYRIPSAPTVVRTIAVFAIPVVVALLWTIYTDIIKSQNPMGVSLTSSALSAWNFGSLEQRLNLEKMRFWIWNRLITANAAGMFGMTLLAWTLYAGNSQYRKIVLTCLALFLLPLLIFTNLHIRHTYYSACSVIFLLAALVVSAKHLSESVERNRALPYVLFLAALCNITEFQGIWHVFIAPVLEINSLGVGLLFAFVGMVLSFAPNRTRKITIACLGASVVLIIICANLYYLLSVETGIVIILWTFALAVIVVICRVARSDRRLIMYPLLITFLACSNLYHFSRGYAKYLWLPGEAPKATALAVGEAIARLTEKDSAIVVFGFDWSSEIAYYAERKSFTVPDRFAKYQEAWFNPAQFLGGKKLGAMVFCDSQKITSMAQVLEQPNVKRQPRLRRIGACYVWIAE